MSAPAGFAAAVAAFLMTRPAPPPPRAVALVATAVPSAAAALGPWLGDAAGVVAFGEVHQDTSTVGIRSSLARFTDDLLPALAPRASHLVVETWVTTGACGAAEQQVTKDVARVTERPAQTENEIVRLLRRAKESGVAPHVLSVSCAEYARLAGGKGAVDYEALLALTRQHLQSAILEALALPRAKDRPLVLVYGGALHNDLYPDKALAPFAFGPALHALMRGDYREVDVYVPELIERLAPMKKERWFGVWRAKERAGQATFIPRSDRSAIIVFPRSSADPSPRPSPR
jgi:hypothetical protein